MADDFRDARDRRIKEIADQAERDGMPRDKAVKWGEQRMADAMPRVVHEREREGKSRPIELRSK